ncbi:hypothetical protein C8R46DRAFT_1353242 [Mycena filopes]|nr:hypothetical protein C8R46DRAFT_1353242 [Mycena filopes]
MSSPFASKVGTNYCPKDEERVEIESLLVEPTLRLNRLDEEILELQTTIDKLAAERETLGAFVDAHTALLSPARRLPLDMVQEIFVACLPTHRNCVMSASEAPVLLGRICSDWRAISLSTPCLWSRIHIVEPSSWSASPLLAEKLAQRLETTKIWLDRSGQCPLSISFEGGMSGHESPPGTPSNHSAAERFLHALVPFSRRWRQIHFTAPLSTLLQTMSHLNETDVPLLESVALYHHFYHQIDDAAFGPLQMLLAPRISSFSTPANMFRVASRTFSPLRWQKLTRLFIDGPPWNVGSEMNSEGMLGIIAQCPELRFCRIGINDGEDRPVPYQHPVVELPSLHTLEVHCAEQMGPAISFFLERISSPKLCSFTFRGYTQTHHSQSLAQFFARSPVLETLEIDSLAFSRAALIESLRALPPTMRRLGIHNLSNRWGMEAPSSLADETLAVLTPTPGLPVQCPGLRDILITHCIKIGDESLLRFITARMDWPHPTLERVEVQFDRTMDLDIKPALEPFIDSGLKVSISHYIPAPTRFSPWSGLSDAPPPPAENYLPPMASIW